MARKLKPGIRFVTEEMPDRDVIVKCANKHETFRLIVRVRLSGAMVTRHAQCTECGEEQPVD